MGYYSTPSYMNGPRLKLITAPATEPVSLSEMKDFLRLPESETSDDAALTAFIQSARQTLEEYTMRAFITQTWDVVYDSFYPFERAELDYEGVRQLPISELYGYGSGFLRIPRPPLQTVTVYSTNPANTETTFSSSLYFVDTHSDPGRICLEDTEIWPVDLRNLQAVRVRFVAGYGTAATDVPAPIRNAIKILAGYLFEQRGCGSEEMPKAVKQLLNAYRILRL